jgi:hypothetical protein
MKTLFKVEIEPVFVDGYIPPFEEMEDNKIYISEEYMTSTHRCLCGCGTKTVLPLNRLGETFGWNLIKENNGTVSFTPSILNPVRIEKYVDEGDRFNPCGAHYIITKNVANFV